MSWMGAILLCCRARELIGELIQGLCAFGHLKKFVTAVERVMADFHESTAFWTDALALGRSTLDI